MRRERWNYNYLHEGTERARPADRHGGLWVRGKTVGREGGTREGWWTPSPSLSLLQVHCTLRTPRTPLATHCEFAASFPPSPAH